MLENVNTLKIEALKSIKASTNEKDLRDIEIKYLGRKSEFKFFANEISKLDKEERPKAGQMINQSKIGIENAIELKKAEIEKEKMNNLALKDWVDVTLPSYQKREGRRHPVSVFLDEIVDVFTRIGFTEADGPEVESEWYNFTALNLDADHPAREMQDTFFIKDLKAEKKEFMKDDRDLGMVLRTQTSSMQIRYMQEHKPPIRIFAPGKVFRRDSDATHSPMFHQVEGLIVDENISLRNLKAVLIESLRVLLEKPSLDLRFRLSYFPFTEPSLEIDILFPMKGKEDNWLELGGAGMVHPNVLKNVGIDPSKYNGFAFGLGIDRLVMIKHNIKDLRLFFENDVRFLRQF